MICIFIFTTKRAVCAACGPRRKMCLKTKWKYMKKRRYFKPTTMRKRRLPENFLTRPQNYPLGAKLPSQNGWLCVAFLISFIKNNINLYFHKINLFFFWQKTQGFFLKSRRAKVGRFKHAGFFGQLGVAAFKCQSQIAGCVGKRVHLVAHGKGRQVGLGVV